MTMARADGAAHPHGAPVPSHARGAVRRWLVTWLVASVLALAVLTLVALTIGESIGPLEAGTAAVVGVVAVVLREHRSRNSTQT